MKKRRGYELFTIHRIRKGGVTFNVRLYQQPTLRYWIARAYHWYDMNLEKIPGVKLVESLVNKRRLKRGFEQYVPTWANRDMKCYHLNRKEMVEIIDFEVTEEQYNSLK